MLNPLNLITKFIKSSNQKELDRIGNIVEKINSIEEKVQKLNDDQFPNKTQEFKERIPSSTFSSASNSCASITVSYTHLTQPTKRIV